MAAQAVLFHGNSLAIPAMDQLRVLSRPNQGQQRPLKHLSMSEHISHVPDLAALQQQMLSTFKNKREFGALPTSAMMGRHIWARHVLGTPKQQFTLRAAIR